VFDLWVVSENGSKIIWLDKSNSDLSLIEWNVRLYFLKISCQSPSEPLSLVCAIINNHHKIICMLLWGPVMQRCPFVALLLIVRVCYIATCNLWEAICGN